MKPEEEKALLKEQEKQEKIRADRAEKAAKQALKEKAARKKAEKRQVDKVKADTAVESARLEEKAKKDAARDEEAEEVRRNMTEDDIMNAKAIVVSVFETGSPIAVVAKAHQVKPSELREAIIEFAEVACPEMINFGTKAYADMEFAEKLQRLMQNAAYVAVQVRSLPMERLVDKISPLME